MRLREMRCLPGHTAGVKQLSPRGAGRQGAALLARGRVPLSQADTLLNSYYGLHLLSK